VLEEKWWLVPDDPTDVSVRDVLEVQRIRAVRDRINVDSG
jgi:hypothetical protein